MQFGTPHPSSLEGILRELGFWDRCVCCVDFGDDRCHPRGNQGVLFDTSPSQMQIHKGPGTAAPTSTNINNVGVFPRHTITDGTTPTFLAFDGSNDYASSDIVDSNPQIMIEGTGGSAANKLSWLSVYTQPNTGSAHTAVCVGYDDLSNIQYLKGTTDNINSQASYAATMGDFSAVSPMTVGTTWNFMAHGADGSFDPMLNKDTDVTSAMSYASPYLWTPANGKVPITFGCRRTSLAANNTFWSGRVMLFALFADWCLSIEQMREVKALLRERRLTNLV